MLSLTSSTDLKQLLLIPASQEKTGLYTKLFFSCTLSAGGGVTQRHLTYSALLVGFVGKVIMLGEAEELIGPMNLLLVLALLPLQYTYPSLKPLALYSNVARPGKPGRVLLSVDPMKSVLRGPESGSSQSGWCCVGWRVWEFVIHL
jgi:hypothetical protein